MGAGGDIRGKVSMKKLFGKRNIKKDGTEGKVRGGGAGRRAAGETSALRCMARPGGVSTIGAPCSRPWPGPAALLAHAPPLGPVQLLVLPAVEELQRGEETRWRWVNYSAFDAKVGGGARRPAQQRQSRLSGASYTQAGRRFLPSHPLPQPATQAPRRTLLLAPRRPRLTCTAG